MSMQLSTFKILYGYNKAKTQRWMFAFFLTTEMSPLLLLKKVIGKNGDFNFRLVYRSETF